jgi:hypothetical protein
MPPPFSFHQPVNLFGQVVACDRFPTRIDHPFTVYPDLALAESLDSAEYQGMLPDHAMLPDQLE